MFLSMLLTHDINYDKKGGQIMAVFLNCSNS